MKGSGMVGLFVAVAICFACSAAMLAPLASRGISPDTYAVPASACVAGLTQSDTEVPATVAEACARIARENAEAARQLAAQMAMDAENAARARSMTNALSAAIPIAVIAASIGVAMFALAGIGMFGSNWMRTRSMQVRPGRDGQMPLLLSAQSALALGPDGKWRVVRHDTVHDPNRALGDTTTITTPMITPREVAPAIAAPVADPARQARVATGHQAVQMVSAAHREGITGRESRRVKDAASAQLAFDDEEPIEGEASQPADFMRITSTGDALQITSSGDAPMSTSPNVVQTAKIIGAD